MDLGTVPVQKTDRRKEVIDLVFLRRKRSGQGFATKNLYKGD